MTNCDGERIADTRNCTKWPYSKRVYIDRIVWGIVYRTIWKICWKRLGSLRPGLLRLFGAHTRGPALFHGNTWVEMPWNLRLGQHTAFGPRVILYNLGPMTIGDHTIVSQDAYLCGGTHDYNDPTYPLIREEITIGAYVWIGAGAFICPGITIGEGAVVGARAVVTKDVPPWTVVGGNPAREIKKRQLNLSTTKFTRQSDELDSEAGI